jgi:hypothetical protein
MLATSAGLIYVSLQFYPDAWQYSLLLSSPLLMFVYILPEHIRTFYFLITRKPALILTKNELIDNFKGKQYKWSEVKSIGLRFNEGRVPGTRIVLHFNSSEDVVKIADVQLQGKNFDILEDLISFHNRYGKSMDTS